MLHPALTFHDPTRTTASEGRLAGWTIPAKDLSDVAGMPTTLGAPHRAYLAEDTHPLIQSLIDDGALVNAKTVTSELGATIYCERDDTPLLESAAYPGCTPGGSSSGAAVVVAEGLVRAAHGSDAGGSLRVPAAANNVVGFKPQSHGFSAQGFLTRTVADQAFLHNIDLHEDTPRRLRIGVLTEPLFASTDVATDRLEAVFAAADTLAEHHDVFSIRAYAGSTDTFRHFTHRFLGNYAGLDSETTGYLGWVRDQGQNVTPAMMKEAAQHCQTLPVRLRAEWDVDLILTPTVAFNPPPLGYFPSLDHAENFRAQTRWSPWCSLFNITGGPAIAIGAVHLGGIRADDQTVLRVAALVDKQ